MSASNGTAALVHVKDGVAVDCAGVGDLALVDARVPCAPDKSSALRCIVLRGALVRHTGIDIPLAAAARRAHIGLENAGTRSYSHVVANAHGASPLASNSSITVVLEQVRALRHASS